MDGYKFSPTVDSQQDKMAACSRESACLQSPQTWQPASYGIPLFLSSNPQSPLSG